VSSLSCALAWGSPGPNAGSTRALPSSNPLNGPPDVELVAAIARGDREAFRAFYDAWAGRILAYVRALGRERDAAEDVAQEVFLAVWRRAASYRADRGDVAGWLYTITRNRLVDRWRRKGGVVEERDFDFDGLVSRERGPDSRVVDLSVRKALAGLDAEQREALELAYFGGLTYEETAERLSLPLGTLKSRIRAGLARMRTFLAERGAADGDDPE
jgi:RNA polymerase sigma-70 factor (ECF subfamily)